MYQAKDRGRNNFQLFAPGMDRRLKERIAIESSLRTALSSRQLDVHYQPIVDIESQQVVALEALLRWKHPNHGYVRPERFVNVAEEAGLIVPIGEFVLQRAIEDTVRWRQAGASIVPVAINVSAVQLQRSNLAESISRLTKQHGLDPAMLQIELTESAVFERREARAREASQDAVAKLRELGVHIAIDDFGTGYSSLSYLKRWRVDTLKIDRSFVRDLVTDMSDLAIVSAIIAMARHLHIKVVAEGIEGWPQLEKLRTLGLLLRAGVPVRAARAGERLHALPQRLPARSHPAPAGARPAREHRQRRAARAAGLKSPRRRRHRRTFPALGSPPGPGSRPVGTCENAGMGSPQNTSFLKEPPRQQCADAVLMVRPQAFGFNPETAATNTFQKPPAPGEADAAALARREFDQLSRALAAEGVEVCVVEDSAVPVKPDALFPNNWVSFHPCGTLVLYPLANRSRRPERRQDVIDEVVARLKFKVRHLLDLAGYEGEGKYLEGTGSLVIDHVNRLAYACTSPRTHPELVREWCREMKFEPVIFAATNASGMPLYHTNVCLWIGSRVAVLAAEAIATADRERVLAHLAASGREVLLITQEELQHFAGNMLELGTWDEALGDSRVLVMSESARQALQPRTFTQLTGCTDTVLAVPVPTIEKLGGGSVRCMLAEVFR